MSKCQNLKVTAYSADWADGVPAAGGGGQSEHHEEGGGHPLRLPLPDLHLPGAPLRHLLHVVSGCVVCQEVPGLWSVVGASLVAGAVLVSSARKLLPGTRPLAWCRHQPGEAEHQQRLRS